MRSKKPRRANGCTEGKETGKNVLPCNARVTYSDMAIKATITGTGHVHANVAYALFLGLLNTSSERPQINYYKDGTWEVSALITPDMRPVIDYCLNSCFPIQ